MAIPTLTMIPSGYKAGKIYSVLPTNGDGDFTTSRSSSATRLNKSGLIETVLSNVPRLDYSDGSCPSLLLEPQSTNIIPYSEQFNNWSDTGVTVTSNATISPSGELNADKLQSTTNNWRRSRSYTATNGTEYSVSIYAKLDTSTSTTTAKIEMYRGSNSIASTFNLSTGSISGSLDNTFIENVGNGWYRIGGTYVANGTNNIFYLYPSSGYSSAGTMFFWGAQVEQQSYPTSYISTNGSAVTRNLDTCFGAGDSSTFNISEGVLYAEIKSFTNDISSYQSIQLGVSGSSVNRVGFGYSSTGNLFVYKHNGVTSWNSQYSSNLKTYNKIAITYSNSVNSFWLNGVKIATNTSVGELTSQPNILSFNSPTSSERFYNKTKDLRYYNTALTDAELQELTTI